MRRRDRPGAPRRGGHGEPTVGTLPLLAAISITIRPVLAAGGFPPDAPWPPFWPPVHPGRGWAPHSARAPKRCVRQARRALLAARHRHREHPVFDIAAALSMASDDAQNGCCATGSPTVGTATNRSCPPTTSCRHWQRPSPQTITAWHPINAGQGVAMLRTVGPAVEVIDQLCADASRLLDRRSTP